MKVPFFKNLEPSADKFNFFEKSIDICRCISSKFDFSKEYTENEIKQFGKFVLCFEIEIEHVSGKTVNES